MVAVDGPAEVAAEDGQAEVAAAVGKVAADGINK